MSVYQETTNIKDIRVGTGTVKRVYNRSSYPTPIIYQRHTWKTFGGMNISPALLRRIGENISDIELNYKTDWTSMDYNYYRNSFNNLGRYFDTDKSSFSSNSNQDIDNHYTLSGFGYSDWRVPTKTEWETIIGSSRAGAVVNGSYGKHYAQVMITDPSTVDGAEGKELNYLYGLLIAPDSVTVSGMKSLTWDSSASSNYITCAEVYAYTDAGFAFLPAWGIENQYNIGTQGKYQTASTYSSGYNYVLFFNGSSISTTNTVGKNNSITAILVRGYPDLPVTIALVKASSVTGVVGVTIVDNSNSSNQWGSSFSNSPGTTSTMSSTMKGCTGVTVTVTASSSVARRFTITDQYADHNSGSITMSNGSGSYSLNVNTWVASSGGTLYLKINVIY